jgi:hypothetical protein
MVAVGEHEAATAAHTLVAAGAYGMQSRLPPKPRLAPVEPMRLRSADEGVHRVSDRLQTRHISLCIGTCAGQGSLGFL